MFRTALVLLAVLCIMVAIVAVVGYALPQNHVASREAMVSATPEEVFAVLQDIEAYPKWRSDVTKVEVLARDPVPRWRERGSNGTITFEMQEAQRATRMVGRIADTSLAFGGSWTYVLTPDATGTRVSITENGEIYNPIFRFMSRFVFGQTATLDRYLADLVRHLRPASVTAS
jgi:hypothetical protein